MRFAIATIDRYLGVFEAFIQCGWKPLKLFTLPSKETLDNQEAVIALAERHGASIQLSRLKKGDLRELKDQGCDALIVASYNWKICDWTPFLKYAVNFHSSPLPEGRGPYPAVRAILEQRQSWAITCHQLSPAIDQGAVLLSEHFPLQPDECHESIDLKIQMAGRRLAGNVSLNFENLWNAAAPQAEGSYWKKPETEDRVIDFGKSVDETMRHIRAYGNLECLALINTTWFLVKRAVGWTESHAEKPGHVAHIFNQYIVVAVSDGYIGLLESEICPESIAASLSKGKESKNSGGLIADTAPLIRLN